MNKSLYAAALVAAVFFSQSLFADDSPWTFNQGPMEQTQSIPTKDKSLDQIVAENLINAYRENSSKVSIHRCLFHISCSHFAEKAINRYGLFFGSVVFIDRYFFRENSNSRQNYPLIGEFDGAFKLDDDFFVP